MTAGNTVLGPHTLICVLQYSSLVGRQCGETIPEHAGPWTGQ